MSPKVGRISATSSDSDGDSSATKSAHKKRSKKPASKPPSTVRSTTPRTRDSKETENVVHDWHDYRLELNERLYLWLHRKVGQLSKTWITHTLLLLTMVLYALLGALLFQLAEGNDDENEKKNNFEFRPKLLDLIITEKEIHGPFDTQREVDAFLASMTKGFQEYEQSVLSNYNYNAKMDRGKDELNWEFWSTVFFCCTVFTTIGYGHMFPVTTFGRALSMIYAIIGIPLFLIVLTDFGIVLTRVIKFLWMIFRRIYYTGGIRKPEEDARSDDEDIEMGMESSDERLKLETEDDQSAPLPISLCLVFFAMYIFLGSILFFLWEEWTFFESFYFLFISMTTLGLGDFVPKNHQNMMFSIVFMGFGLALSSMCINVVRERLVESMIEASAKIGQKYGIEIEVDHDLAEDPGEKKDHHKKESELD